MLGLTFDKILVIAVIAVFLVGPTRLPGYAAKLAQFVRNLRVMATDAKDRMRDEMGPEFDDIDWKKLDPRQYDPRRIIRDALLDDEPAPTLGRPSASDAVAGVAVVAASTGPALSAGERPPFDTEAT